MKTPNNTDTFTFYNANTKGRKTSDCIPRAVSLALGLNYEAVIIEMTRFSLETGYFINDPKLLDKYLQYKGWVKQSQPKKADGRKYKGSEFAKLFNGVCVANVGGHHTTCVKDNKIYDIWDCTEGCVGNYWVPQA